MSANLRQSGIRPNQFGNKFDLALEKGGEFEDFLNGLIANAKVECKRDYRAKSTGNIFVEYECRGKPSGIEVTQADWWAFGIDGANGDIETIVLVSTPCLREKVNQLRRQGRVRPGGDDGKAMGALLPFYELKNL